MRKVGFRRGKVQVRWDSDGFFNNLSVVLLSLTLIITILILILFPDSWKVSWGAVALPGILGVVFGILYFTVEK